MSFYDMRKTITFIALCITLCLSSCYDDSAIWQSIKDHEARIVTLETLCSQMNTNISSIQSLIQSMQTGDFITGITPIDENDKEIGYTINFASGKNITVYHGKDGIDGAAGYIPAIGVKQDNDGAYYWTLDGEWILGENNEKIPTSGKDGKDAVTPKIKLEDKSWYISYDNGSTWTKIGDVSSGNTDNDLFFKEIKHDEHFVYITLHDNTVITIQKHVKLSIILNTDDFVITPGLSSKLNYTLEGYIGKPEIFTITENGWSAEVVQTNDAEGYILVTIPENNYDKGRLTLWVSNNGSSIAKQITYSNTKSSVINIEEESLNINYLGGNMEVSYCSGIETELIIPEDAREWLSVVEAKSQFCYNKLLCVAKNTGGDRSALITIKNEFSEVTINLTQNGISGITIIPSKAFILSDGSDYTQLNVFTFEGEEITQYSSIWDENNTLFTLTDNKFSTTEQGVFKFRATYGTHISEDVQIFATDTPISLDVADNQPNNISFKHRSFLLRYTGTACPYCSIVIDDIRQLKSENIIPNNAVLAVAHTYNREDPAYTPLSFLKLNSYPDVRINNTSSNLYQSGSAYKLMKDYIESESKESADVGIAVNATRVSGTLVLNVGVKAAVDGTYAVNVWVLQDGIYGRQQTADGSAASYRNYHDDCIIAAAYPSVVGQNLGVISQKQIVKNQFIFDIESNIEDEALHVVITVAKQNASGWKICNAIDCPISGATNFEYNQ